VLGQPNGHVEHVRHGGGSFELHLDPPSRD
jgi:hypothetical protein